MKNYIKLALAALVCFGSATIASAQFDGLVVDAITNNPPLNGIVGFVSGSDYTFVYWNGGSWSTARNGAMFANGTGATFGVADFTAGAGVFQASGHYSLANVSCRATITGGAFTNDMGNRTLRTWAYMFSAGKVSILGPTLDQYGVHGARNFSWTITNTADGTQWTGNGECSIPVSSSQRTSIVVEVTPNYFFENGDVLIQYDAP